jgi:Ca-activated chloride channel family protein
MTLFNEVLSPASDASRARLPLIYFCLVFLILICQVNTRAQEDSDLEVVRVRTDLITVPAFVTDARGRRVSDLTVADFVLLDEGRAVKIEYFAAGAERVALLFALDSSGSAREIIEQQRETALALFSRFGRGSEVAVLRFAEKAVTAAAFSTSEDNALKAFALPALTNRRTAIFDAAFDGVKAFDSRRAQVAERRIIILISDGLDTVSVTRPRKVIEAARESGVSIYTIQLPLYAPRNGKLAPRPATKGFREMAEQTGGRYFLAGDAKSALALRPEFDLTQIFQAIEEDLRGQYVLGYYPEDAARDNRLHRLKLNLTTKDKQKLRAHLLRDSYTLK